MKDTVIVGVCATGRVVLDCLIASGAKGTIAGFLGAGKGGPAAPAELDGFPVLGTLDEIARFKDERGIRRAVVGVGESALRESLCRRLADAGIALINAVHPSAVITGGVEMGENVIVAPGAVVGVGSRIDDGVLLNTSCSVDHDCRVGAFAHICPGTRLAGNVTIGRRAWVGIGTSVMQGIRIGEDAFVGAGAVVVKDIPAGVLAYGCPARVVRELSEGERGRIVT